MTIFVSVVSHSHGKVISELNCLLELSEDIVVVVKNNIEDSNLFTYLEGSNIHLIDSEYFLGFGHNNNIVFSYCKNKLGMRNDDYFIVLNPDLFANSINLKDLIFNMEKQGVQLASVNLFKDSNLEVPDNSIRRFPTLPDFILSFLGLGNPSLIDKKRIFDPVRVDWAAGSLLAFKSSHYDLLKGFDEGYFMYCEDIDICYRSSLLGERLMFYPHIKLQHLTKHANRSVFSKHFAWHIKGIVRYLCVKHGLISSKISLS
ncbi:glycosyltransferase family 2 protein [Vibrio cyclitrophicus]